MTSWRIAISLIAVHWSLSTGHCQERTVLDDDFPGAYQVEVADVDGDGKPDVVALGGGTVAWYQNPTWTKRVVTGPSRTPGVISSAAADLDGDGKAEVAIAYEFAMNQPTKGRLGLASQGATLDDPWTFRPIADVPSIHRLRWADLDADRRPELVVAPIFGPESTPPRFQEGPARLAVFTPGGRPKDDPWTSQVVHERPVVHAIEVKRFPDADRDVILTADNLGVSIGGGPRLDDGRFALKWRSLVAGVEGEAPKRGCSEIHAGRYADGRGFLATIEPWHGTVVAIWDESPAGSKRYESSRRVLDDTLTDGHALWVADIDGDGNDEVFAGHRGKDQRVSMYRSDGKGWARTVIDTNIAAQDLRGGDLDGDGVPEVVAVGGRTKNVVLYKFPKKAGGR